MSLNENLQRAKRSKNDEFYTQLSDIENELRHYTGHFAGKVVYCNCDWPSNSNTSRSSESTSDWKIGLKRRTGGTGSSMSISIPYIASGF